MLKKLFGGSKDLKDLEKQKEEQQAKIEQAKKDLEEQRKREAEKKKQQMKAQAQKPAATKKAVNPYLDDALLNEISHGIKSDKVKVEELKPQPVDATVKAKVKSKLDDDAKFSKESTPKKEVSPIKIGTRKSQLAMWQAEYAKGLIEKNIPGQIFFIVGIVTEADKNQSTPLSQFSDKGVFTKEIDTALLNKQIDCALHCVKDLPTVLPKGLKISCFLPRGIENDCCLFDKTRFPNVNSLKDFPKGSKIGTSSLRRIAMVKSMNKDVQLEDIRGNLNTRLKKLINEKLYDGIILAQIGVERLGWMGKNEEKKDNEVDLAKLKVVTIPTKDMAYAPGQGGLAIVIRNDDTSLEEKLKKSSMDDIDGRIRCSMERSLLKELEGGCKIPIGCISNVYIKCDSCGLLNSWNCSHCFACFDGIRNIKLFGKCNVKIKLSLVGVVYTQDGGKKVQAKKNIDVDWTGLSGKENVEKEAVRLGAVVADELKKNGAKEIIDFIKKNAK